MYRDNWLQLPFLHPGFLESLSTAEYSYSVHSTGLPGTLAEAGELRRKELLNSEDHVFLFAFEWCLFTFELLTLPANWALRLEIFKSWCMTSFADFISLLHVWKVKPACVCVCMYICMSVLSWHLLFWLPPWPFLLFGEKSDSCQSGHYNSKVALSWLLTFHPRCLLRQLWGEEIVSLQNILSSFWRSVQQEFMKDGYSLDRYSWEKKRAPLEGWIFSLVWLFAWESFLSVLGQTEWIPGLCTPQGLNTHILHTLLWLISVTHSFVGKRFQNKHNQFT